MEALRALQKLDDLHQLLFGLLDAGNVGKLSLAFTFSTGVLRGHEAAPIVAGDTLYLVTPFPNVVYALDLTTRELLEELRDRHTPGLEHGTLAQLLHDADLVKFARLNPSDDACSKAINGAFALVEATRVKEEVKESA